MKVVFLTQRVPYPPDRGDRITTHHFLRHFLARGARVRVGCLAEDARDVESARAVGDLVDEVCAPLAQPSLRRTTCLRGLLTGEALSLPYFRTRQLRAAVRGWMRDDPPDVVYMYSSSMAQYALSPEIPGPVPLRVMQFAELDSDKWRQFAERAHGAAAWIYRREARRLLEFERRVAREFEVSTVVSEVERELFMRHIPDVQPHVVRNGVDVDHFTSAGDDRREPHTAIFTGVMNYEPNVDAVTWFVRECWPGIRARVADARFLIVGSRPAPEVQRLASEAAGIEVTGRVPQTPPWFDVASVAVAPLRLARGVQNKVLEAMSMGLPVVGTAQAAQGLGEIPDGVLVRAEGAAATTEAVCRLFEHPEEARTIGARAARLVREEFRWDAVFARFDAILEERLAARGTPKGAP